MARGPRRSGHCELGRHAASSENRNGRSFEDAVSNIHGFENTKGPKYPDCPSSGTKQRADAVALPSLSLLQNPTVSRKMDVWRSGLGTDRRRRFNPSYRALREFLSEGRSPFSLDPYLSRMSPGISALRCHRLRHPNSSTLLPKFFNRMPPTGRGSIWPEASGNAPMALEGRIVSAGTKCRVDCRTPLRTGNDRPRRRLLLW